MSLVGDGAPGFIAEEYLVSAALAVASLDGKDWPSACDLQDLCSNPDGQRSLAVARVAVEAFLTSHTPAREEFLEFLQVSLSNYRAAGLDNEADALTAVLTEYSALLAGQVLSSEKARKILEG